MARTIATGNQPGGRNPFGQAASGIGQALGSFLRRRIQEKRQEGQARELARLFGGGQQGGQQNQPVQPPQPDEQGRNPFSVPAMQDGQVVSRATGQQASQNPLVAAGVLPRGAPTAGRVGHNVIQQTLESRGAMPGQGQQTNVQSRPSPAASGSPQGAPAGGGQQGMGGRQAPRIGQNRTQQGMGGPQIGQQPTRQGGGQQQGTQLTAAGQRPQMDPEVERTARAVEGQRSGLGGMLARMPMEQRTQMIMNMQQQGVRTDQIMEMAAPRERERPDPNTDLAKLRTDFQSGLINREEFMAQRQRILEGGQNDPLSTDELEAQTIQQINTGEISREEGQQRLQLIRGPQGGDLSAKARTVATLERRKRGEETGTSMDSFTPDRAGEFQDALINQPQRYQVQTDQFGRQFMLDTQSGDQTLITDRPGIVNAPAPGTSGQGQGAAGQDPSGQAGVGGQVSTEQGATGQPPEAAGSERPSTASRLVSGRGELGIVGRIQQFGNVLMPQFGSQLPQPERTEIANDLQGMRERLVSALRDNRRLLSTQVATIQNLLPDPQAFFDNTPQALAQMTAARGRLLEDRNNLERIANDPRTPSESALEAQQAVQQIDPIIGELSVNADTFAQADAEQSFEFAQALTPTAARGLDAGTVDSMVGKLTDDQLSNLSPDVSSVLIDKLRGNADGNGN